MIDCTNEYYAKAVGFLASIYEINEDEKKSIYYYKLGIMYDSLICTINFTALISYNLKQIYDKYYMAIEQLFENEKSIVNKDLYKYKLDNNLLCIICFEDYNLTLKCNHRFCLNCVKKLSKNECAYCRTQY